MYRLSRAISRSRENARELRLTSSPIRPLMQREADKAQSDRVCWLPWLSGHEFAFDCSLPPPPPSLCRSTTIPTKATSWTTRWAARAAASPTATASAFLYAARHARAHRQSLPTLPRTGPPVLHASMTCVCSARLSFQGASSVVPSLKLSRPRNAVPVLYCKRKKQYSINHGVSAAPKIEVSAWSPDDGYFPVFLPYIF